MKRRLRFDFPPEVVQERNQVYDRIRELLAEQTLEAVLKARQMNLDWLQQYPDDYIALDAGEMIAMAEAAHERSGDKPDTRGSVRDEAAV